MNLQTMMRDALAYKIGLLFMECEQANVEVQFLRAELQKQNEANAAKAATDSKETS